MLQELTLEDKLKLIKDRLVAQTRLQFSKFESDAHIAFLDALERICDKALESGAQTNYSQVFQEFINYIQQYEKTPSKREIPKTHTEIYQLIAKTIAPYREQRKPFKARDIAEATGLSVEQISFYLSNYNFSIRSRKGQH
ncbi:hypothetical protein HYT51_02070 [Candidatus Woesearchaeota archaeon]|nr:hypothetical protein [Candidatus Woesearchaeota archaeon]